MKKHTFLSKKFSVSFLLTLFLSAHLISCQDNIEGQREYPRVKTLEVVNINNSGATFRGEVESLGNSPVDNYGFVWGTNEQLSASANDFVDIDIQLGSSYFETRVQRALDTQRNYYVRAYARVKGKVIYSEAVLFKSLGSEAPQITSFEPRTAAWGDTITIKGKNFSNVASQLKLQFGIARVPTGGFVESPSDSMVIVQVPFGLGDSECYLSVDIFGNTSQFYTYRFKLVPLTITDFSPKTAGWGDIITATGTNLNNPNLKYTLGGIEIKKLNFTSRNTITLTVPDELNTLENSLRAEFNSISASASTTLKLQQPAITGFTPATATWGQEVTVNGNFHYNKAYSKIFFNTTEAAILDYSKNSIKVVVPLQLTTPNPSGAIPLYYKANSIQVQANNSFELQGPSITSFSPQQAGAGSRITIEGNFSTKNTKIYFGEKEATIFSITQQRLIAIVPTNTSGMVKIKAVVGSQVAVSTDDFEATNPKIIDFYPKTAGFGDELTISGEYLNIEPEQTQIRFFETWDTSYNWGGTKAEITEISPNTIIFRIPFLFAANQKIVLYIGNNKHVLNDYFKLLPPIISNYSPTSGIANRVFTINGENFVWDPHNNRVYFGDIEAKVLSNEKNKIVVDAKIPRGVYKLSVEWYGTKDESDVLYESFSPWLRVKYDNYTSIHVIPGCTFSDNERAYIFMPSTLYNSHREYRSYFYTFNPLVNTLSYSAIPDIPNIGRVYNTTDFTFNNSFIRVGGLNSSYSPASTVLAYDIFLEEWTQLNSFPGQYRQLGFSLSFSNKAYIGGGFNNAAETSPLHDFWEYNPVDDSWEQKNNIPFETIYGSYCSTTTNNKGFVIHSNGEVWEYDPTSDTWIKKTDFPGERRFFATCFAINNIIYYGTGRQAYIFNESTKEYEDFWAYNIDSDTWIKKTDFPGQLRSESSSFSFNGKGYWGLGRNAFGNFFNGINDFYEYDPTLEP